MRCSGSRSPRLPVLAQATRGRLPTDVSASGLRYESDAADDVAAALADLQEQLDDLEATVDELADRVHAISRRP